MLIVPPIVGYMAWRLMNGLRASGAERLRDMPLAAVFHSERSSKEPVEREVQPRIAVYQDGNRWRWRYRVGSTRSVLDSNKSFPNAAAAIRSAQRSYPDATVEETVTDGR